MSEFRSQIKKNISFDLRKMYKCQVFTMQNISLLNHTDCLNNFNSIKCLYSVKKSVVLYLSHD